MPASHGVRRMRLGTVVVALVAAVATWTFATVVRGQATLPPVSYVCPMPEHAEVVLDAPGTCPLCGMTLLPVRIDLAWSCPDHPAVITDRQGVCPIDKRELVQVTIQEHWQCADDPTVHFVEPGRCGSGAARRRVREIRAHGDHNPRHGGQFFMASNKWHHVEGTYPSKGLFVLFLYDNFTKPLSPEEARLNGRVVTREARDPATGIWRDLEAFPLRLSRDGKTLRAQLKGNVQLPLSATVKIRFNKDTPEERFDFQFKEYSTEPKRPVTGPPVRQTTRAVETAPVVPAPVPAPAPDPVESQDTPSAGNLVVGISGSTPPPVEEILPETVPELLDLLRTRGQEARDLIRNRELTSIYVPALRSKAIALALENHVDTLPPQQQVVAKRAIKRIVLSAWQLDYAGDLGNLQTAEDIFGTLDSAISSLQSAYASVR